MRAVFDCSHQIYMVADLLLNIGLTLNEAKIYDYLIVNSMSSATSITKQLKISRSGVYATLGSLREKSLVVYDKNSNTWSALEFDDYAENLLTELKYLKCKLTQVSKKSNVVKLSLESSFSKNKLLFNRLVADSQKVCTYLVCSTNPVRSLMLSKLNTKNLIVISDEKVSFLCKRNVVLSSENFYEKLIVVIANDIAYMFFDDFRFLLKIKDIDFLSFISQKFVEKNA